MPHVSQAYLSISLDATGLLRFLAFWVASKGGSSGRRLYAYLYAFFLLCGVVVGNVSGLGGLDVCTCLRSLLMWL